MRTAALLKRHVFGAAVVALALVAQVELWAGSVPGPKLALVPGMILATLPLLFRRRFPFAASACVFAALVALTLADPEATASTDATSFALLLAFWSVGAHTEGRQAVAGLLIGLASIAVVIERDPTIGHGDQAGLYLIGGGVWFAALALERRSRHAAELEERAGRLEHEREERERAAVAEERRRIARDLHDVIAHSVGVMTVQAGAARLLLAEEPERAREPLLAVEEAGRQALAEMRRLLGILRRREGEAELAPQPGLARLGELLAQARAAGLPVELRVEGEPRTLPTGIDLAAYRIVQEALTNARKHAGPARAQLAVRYAEETLELEIANDGWAVANGDGGHGLVGMRERVSLYGGELAAGPRPGGGYVVRARLPLGPARPPLASASPPQSRLREPPPSPESHAIGDGDGLRGRLSRHAFDALVVLVAVVSEVQIWVSSVPGPKLVLVPCVLLWTLPLLWRRRFPFAAPVFAFGVQALSTFAGDAVGGVFTAYAALLLTFWAVGAHNARPQVLAGVAIGVATIVLGTHRDVRVDAGQMVSAIVTGGALALVAYALQRRGRHAAELEERAARLEREREEMERAAVAEERRRIARDLHDVIAHSVGVMTVQAGAARLLLAEEPKRAREPLLAVEEAGRQALAEMRRLLGILRREEGEAELAPQPGLARLGELLAQARAAGLPVELRVEGEPRTLSAGVDLAAYRIVQEALTNARRHAGPARARVSLRYGREALEVEIADDGRVAANGDDDGYGLVGMRERAALYGGTFEAGPRAEGGYTVRTRLPVEAGRP